MSKVTDLELASTTAACLMPDLNRLWDNSKCCPTMGPLIAGVRKVAKMLAESATEAPPAGCPTAEELFREFCNAMSGSACTILCGTSLARAGDEVILPFEAVAQMLRSRWPRVVMPSREEIIRCLIDNAHRAADVADAVLDLLRPVAVELDEEELARRIDRIQCIQAAGPVTLDTPAIARAAIVYFNEKMGQGERKAGTAPPRCAPPEASPAASDAPPASTCKVCGGTGKIPVPCPHGKPGCCTAHYEPCRECAIVWPPSDAPPVATSKDDDTVKRAAFLGKPTVPTYAERRAALVAKCKAVCEQCRLYPWSHMDTDNLAWAWHADSPGRDFCEARHVSPCLRTRREIAKLDAEEAAKAKAPPAPDDAVSVTLTMDDGSTISRISESASDGTLKTEALALCNAERGSRGLAPLTMEVFIQTDEEAIGLFLFLAREVRRQIAEELEATIYPGTSELRKMSNADIARRIAKLRGETT